MWRTRRRCRHRLADSDLESGAVTELKEGALGLSVASLVAVASFVAYSPTIGVFPPPTVIPTIPLIYAVASFSAHLVGGTVTGLLADRFH